MTELLRNGGSVMLNCALTQQPECIDIANLMQLQMYDVKALSPA